MSCHGGHVSLWFSRRYTPTFEKNLSASCTYDSSLVSHIGTTHIFFESSRGRDFSVFLLVAGEMNRRSTHTEERAPEEGRRVIQKMTEDEIELIPVWQISNTIEEEKSVQLERDSLRRGREEERRRRGNQRITFAGWRGKLAGTWRRRTVGSSYELRFPFGLENRKQRAWRAAKALPKAKPTHLVLSCGSSYFQHRSVSRRRNMRVETTTTTAPDAP